MSSRTPPADLPVADAERFNVFLNKVDQLESPDKKAEAAVKFFKDLSEAGADGSTLMLHIVKTMYEENPSWLGSTTKGIITDALVKIFSHRGQAAGAIAAAAGEVAATQKLLDAAVAKQAEAKAKHTNWQKTALVVSGINEAVIVFTKEKVEASKKAKSMVKEANKNVNDATARADAAEAQAQAQAQEIAQANARAQTAEAELYKNMKDADERKKKLFKAMEAKRAQVEQKKEQLKKEMADLDIDFLKVESHYMEEAGSESEM